MRPPSFKMEPPPDHHHHIKPLLPPPLTTTMLHHPTIQLNQLPPAKPSSAPDSDQTDYSTSFAQTESTNDNSFSTLSDAEVDSKLHTHASAFDDFGTAFRARKKKLTSHWRSFIRPVMWRCKWAELKTKQLESQALKYAKIIAALDEAKHLANQSIPEGLNSRSMAFTYQRRRSKLMKRRKRVRVEDTMDAKLYMSKHIIFSYDENRKSDPDGISVTDDFDDPVMRGDKKTISSEEEVGFDMHNNKKWSFIEGKDNDNDMEQILVKIETSQIRVKKLKAKVDVLMAENVGPTFENGGSSIQFENVEVYHIPPDIIESTEGLPSSVDVTHHHHSQLADSSENIVDNMVVHLKQGGEEEKKHTLRNFQEQQEGETSEEEEEEDITDSSFASGFQIPTNKRKRGDRKASTGNWSRQCHADDPAADTH